MLKIFTRFSTYTLLVALAISAVAEFYSIVGLTTIFASAVIPTIIMGVVLGLGKLTATVWLKLNWERATITHKLYLIPAIIVLMFLTSMGIFGFLSKAHSDQSLVSGDVQGKIAIYDEKIKTARENIEANRKQLKQMDEAVDQVMARSTSEDGATKANNIRKSQQRDRVAIAKDIEANQKLIAKLNDEAAPIRAEIRKVEAEVGPIKYIAAMIYGDTADNNLLEAAVRWVIILIVVVFDPLALMLLLAAQQSMKWDKEDEQAKNDKDEKEVEDFFTRGRLVARGLDADEDQRLVKEANEKIAEIEPDDTRHGFVAQEVASVLPHVVIVEPELGNCFKCDTALVNVPGIGPFCPNKSCDVVDNTDDVKIQWKYTAPVVERTILEQHPYLNQPFDHFKDLTPMVYKPEAATEEEKPKKRRVVKKTPVEAKEVAPVTPVVTAVSDIETDGVTTEAQLFHPSQEYVSYDGKSMSINALKASRPDLVLKDTDPVNQILFGNKFPDFARTGDMYVRTDTLPHRVYKFNGKKWITIDKGQNSSYLHYIPYINHLIDKLGSGEYDAELLTEDEQEEIARHLEKNKQ